jgi:hypothetical protein
LLLMILSCMSLTMSRGGVESKWYFFD